MEVNSGVVLLTQKVGNNVVSRPVANFQPSVWGEGFLQKISDKSQARLLEDDEQVHRDLVEEVRRELVSAATNSLQQLQLIDSIQRLGVAYHFESEIERALQAVFETYDVDDLQRVEPNSLYRAALCFRLLRQQGYPISCDVFHKFKDGKGKFIDSISSDVRGMLEFYEATHLSIHGDDILDEALAFTTTQLALKLVSPDLKHNVPLTDQLIHALKQSNRRGIPRLEARGYMPIYEKNASHNKSLLRLAKLDFNQLQSMHKRELTEICMWWKSLDVPRKLSFARDRVVEGYFWILGIYFEPEFVLARKILTKVFALTSIIDDMYDAYGTFEELKLFTEAIERWSIDSLDQLPEYMKICYQALLELYEEIDEEMVRQGKEYCTDYAKEAIKILARAYFEETKWMEQKYTPTPKEYMSVAIRSCGMRSLTISSFLGMGDVATKEHFEWALEERRLINASSIICRLQDDIMGHEFDKKRKHIPSAVECYMKGHNASEQEAVSELKKQMEAAWKELNGGFLRPKTIPHPLLLRILNFARVMEVVYKEDDWYTHVSPEMQSYITQIMIDPIPM